MKLLSKWRVRKPADDTETVYVSERFGVRSLHIGSDTVQSSMRLARPNDLELSYTRSMMAFLLFRPPPAQMLQIGLGGGSLAKFVYHRLPHTATTAVEVNPRVVAVAHQYFNLPTEDGRFKVIVEDGAAYINRPEVSADVLVVDGYEADSHVEALASKAFYSACRERLASGGMLIVNLWGGDKLFHTLLGRIQQCFPHGTLCLPAERPGNVIVLAFRDAPQPLLWSVLARTALELETAYDLEFPKFVIALRTMNRHDDECLYPRQNP